MKNVLIGGIIVFLILIIGGLFMWNSRSPQNLPTPSVQVSLSPASATGTPVATTAPATQQTFRFSNPKKSAHYESNTPAHGSVLPGTPTNIVIDFNFDLAPSSAIRIMKDNEDYGVGETIVDTNKLAMRRAMHPAAPDGVYTVEYKACWPDKSCHDGNFQFAIDRSLAGSYNDQTGKREVTIRLSHVQFVPQNVKVSRGTIVTWVNDDAVEHYVNTDSHPAHTYYPAQNSTSLKKGEQFRLTFNEVGVYPYHCSAHADAMTGTLLVV